MTKKKSNGRPRTRYKLPETPPPKIKGETPLERVVNQLEDMEKEKKLNREKREELERQKQESKRG